MRITLFLFILYFMSGCTIVYKTNSIAKQTHKAKKEYQKVLVKADNDYKRRNNAYQNLVKNKAPVNKEPYLELKKILAQMNNDIKSIRLEYKRVDQYNAYWQKVKKRKKTISKDDNEFAKMKKLEGDYDDVGDRSKKLFSSYKKQGERFNELVEKNDIIIGDIKAELTKLEKYMVDANLEIINKRQQLKRYKKSGKNNTQYKKAKKFITFANIQLKEMNALIKNIKKLNIPAGETAIGPGTLYYKEFQNLKTQMERISKGIKAEAKKVNG